nr:sulfatase [Tsuneonella dongtanensis]
MLAAIALAGCTGTPRLGKGAPSADRPNILIVMTDDQSWPHASAYGSDLVDTPAFDRIARSGVLLDNGWVSAPSCGPSRASLITGQDFWRLGPAAMNHTIWQAGTETVFDHLARAGYATGFTGKGWAPGNYKVAGRTESPTGPGFNAHRIAQPGSKVSKVDYSANFDDFLKGAGDKPFLFWVGINEPHRPYFEGVGKLNGKVVEPGEVPDYVPDEPAARGDVADYAYEIEWADGELGEILDTLEKRGELSNTLIVFTSDNGMPFPRAKGMLYASGAHMPMAIAWPAGFAGGRRSAQFVQMPDFGPTIMAAAGLPIPTEMNGHDLLPMLRGQVQTLRDEAVMGMERHFPGGRPDGAGYPSRALRTAEWLFVRNYTPDAYPAGNPQSDVWPEDDPTGGFGDVDGGPTKTLIVKDRARLAQWYDRAFGKRPAEELYAVRDGKTEYVNLAADPKYAAVRKELSARLQRELVRREDPRAMGRGSEFDAWMRKYPVMGSNEAGLQ